MNRPGAGLYRTVMDASATRANRSASSSGSRIKRLRGLAQPQYRLRIGDVRACYDVAGDRVEVLAVVSKAQADAWVQQEGRADEEGGTGEG